MSYQWAEDDGGLPFGVPRLGLQQPENGREYIMYHGTTREAAQSILKSGFRQSAGGMLGPGVYLSRDLDKASRYPIGHPEQDKVVIRVRVNVGNVIIINRQNHPYQKTWHNYGYDTAWVPPNCGMVPSGLEEDCVWDPSRIRIIDTILPRPGVYQWAEDDGDVPFGVGRLGLSEPVSGRKYVMYHGTTKQAAQAIERSGFRQSADGMLGRGVYLSRDLEKAKRYPIDHPEHDKVVIKVVANVGKVIAINHQYHHLRTTWHDHGYDTAWVPPKCGMVKSGLEEDCVWDPSRIKIISIIKPKATSGQVQIPGGCGARRYM